MVDAEEPVLRPRRRQSLLGPLLRPRHRRSARRHARHQPADQPRAARRPGQGPGRQQVQPEAPDQDDRARAGRTSSASMPNEFNKHDKQTYARYYPRRMAAEVLFDAVSQVTDSPAAFGGLPHRQARAEPGDHAAGRVVPVVLPGRVRPAAAHQRLRVRARQRGQPGPGAAPAQLGRGPGQAGARRRPGRRSWPRTRGPTPRRSRSCSCGPSPASRPPSSCNVALAHIAKHATNKKVAYENILWALLQHEGVHLQPISSSFSRDARRTAASPHRSHVAAALLFPSPLQPPIERGVRPNSLPSVALSAQSTCRLRWHSRRANTSTPGDRWDRDSTRTSTRLPLASAR